MQVLIKEAKNIKETRTTAIASNFNSTFVKTLSFDLCLEYAKLSPDPGPPKEPKRRQSQMDEKTCDIGRSPTAI